MNKPRISLEQWRAFVAVVNSGGYAQAAEALNKSQSTVTYAVQRMTNLLDIQLFRMQGRRSVLTPAGEVLCRRGRALLAEAGRLERVAGAELDRQPQGDLDSGSLHGHGICLVRRVQHT